MNKSCGGAFELLVSWLLAFCQWSDIHIRSGKEDKDAEESLDEAEEDAEDWLVMVLSLSLSISKISFFRSFSPFVFDPLFSLAPQ